jgi:DNA repair exonuclease SbcCD ATPase subunit
MVADLEKELDLSAEKLEKLRPALEDKSREIENDLEESIDKGYAEIQSLSGKLQEASREAEKQLEEVLNSDEVKQLKEYLARIDKEAIREVQEELANALTEWLEMTEEQIASFKPALEESFRELGEILDTLAKEGEKNLDEFKKQFDDLNNTLREKLDDSLESDQLEKLEQNREELKKKISQELFTA